MFTEVTSQTVMITTAHKNDTLLHVFVKVQVRIGKKILKIIKTRLFVILLVKPMKSMLLLSNLIISLQLILSKHKRRMST